MRRHRGQGWAAFDHKVREKHGSVTECPVEPYPSISKLAPVYVAKSPINDNLIRSFSSVVRSSVGFLPSTGNHDNQIVDDDVMPVKMLKDMHMWADQDLIDDVLAAANNDVDQASILLKAMVSSNGSYPCEDEENPSEKNNHVECKLFDGDQEGVMSNYSISVPVEPEWEEEDVYLRHRKDAVRMMRMASQHSRAASNAFLRGDHVSAQQYSSKAHDERVESEKLNAEAAKGILSIRNKNNDIWKIDLHGLHASEAVSALAQRLHKIESEMMQSRKEPPRQRQTILHVITGTGSHSRGQASLPAAVKSFLIENGYRFDDGRPGMFAVRPKFRNK